MSENVNKNDNKLSDEYIQGYNEALADLRFLYLTWSSNRFRKPEDPILLKRDTEILNAACNRLRKVIN